MKTHSLRKILSVITAVVVLCSIAVLPASAASDIRWAAGPGMAEDGRVRITSSSDFTILDNLGLQTYMYSADDAGVKTDFADAKVSFDFQITDAEKVNDWGCLYNLRIVNPGVGPWEPSNASLSVFFRKDGVSLTRYSGGQLDENSQKTISCSPFDGEKHSLSLEIKGKNVMLTVDGKSLTVEFNLFPKMGGHQWLAMNAKVHITNFDNYATSDSVPTEPPATQPETIPTEPETIPTKPVQPETEATRPSSEETVPSEETSTPEAAAENSVTTAIVIAVVLLLAAGGITLSIISRKKRR